MKKEELDSSFVATFNKEPVNLTHAHTLLNMGADVNAPAASGSTALMIAAARGDIVAVQFLLSARADIHLGRKHDGMTALMYAVYNDHLDVADILLEARADINQRDANRFLTLHYVARFQPHRADKIDFLVERGADPALCVDGLNALDYARCFGGETDATRRLERIFQSQKEQDKRFSPNNPDFIKRRAAVGNRYKL